VGWGGRGGGDKKGKREKGMEGGAEGGFEEVLLLGASSRSEKEKEKGEGGKRGGYLERKGGRGTELRFFPSTEPFSTCTKEKEKRERKELPAPRKKGSEGRKMPYVVPHIFSSTPSSREVWRRRKKGGKGLRTGGKTVQVRGSYISYSSISSRCNIEKKKK